MMGRDSMGGVGGSSREGEGEGKVKSKETSAARLLNVSIWEYLVGVVACCTHADMMAVVRV